MAVNNPNSQQDMIQAMADAIEEATKGKPQYENTPLIETTEKERAELDRFKNDTELKRNLTVFVVWFTAIWSIVIMAFVYSAGFNWVHVSDKVLITLLTETLGVILGLPLVVTSHFFPKQK